MDSIDTINRKFLDLMAKEVTANIGGQVVVTTNYELFLGEMTKSGNQGQHPGAQACAGLLACGHGGGGAPEDRRDQDRAGSRKL